jgi:NAD(P)-dependent dehydrogenase (short-subunit alcohol dehydrogenase family)
MDQCILITGASSDVGRAIALQLGSGGCGLGLHYHSNPAAVASLQERLARQNCVGHPLPYDLTTADSARAMVDEFIARCGRLDVLINLVGPFDYRDLSEVTPASWEETIALNLHTCFHVAHYATPHLCRTQGHIVNFIFSGADNIKAWPMSTAYCAAKAGVAVLTKSLAATLAPKGVRVNAICPGLVEEGSITAAERQAMAAQIPLGRPVRPEEIAVTVKWLVAESPESMTGSFLSVAGAWEY